MSKGEGAKPRKPKAEQGSIPKGQRKCTPTRYCWHIRHVAHDQGQPDIPGLHIIHYIDMMTGKTTLDILCYKEKRGRNVTPLALNFCPMCGFDMSKRKDWRGDKK